MITTVCYSYSYHITIESYVSQFILQAAIVGTTWGRHPWRQGKSKSVEGTFAAFLSIYLSLYLLLLIIRQHQRYQHPMTDVTTNLQYSFDQQFNDHDKTSIITMTNPSSIAVTTADHLTMISIAMITSVVEVASTIDDNISMPIAAVVTLIFSPFILHV